MTTDLNMWRVWKKTTNYKNFQVNQTKLRLSGKYLPINIPITFFLLCFFWNQTLSINVRLLMTLYNSRRHLAKTFKKCSISSLSYDITTLYYLVCISLKENLCKGLFTFIYTIQPKLLGDWSDLKLNDQHACH